MCRGGCTHSMGKIKGTHDLKATGLVDQVCLPKIVLRKEGCGFHEECTSMALEKNTFWDSAFDRC